MEKSVGFLLYLDYLGESIRENVKFFQYFTEMVPSVAFLGYNSRSGAAWVVI